MEATSESAHHNAIAQSWERCTHRHNLVPGLARPIMRLRREEISHRREALSEAFSDELRLLAQLARLASEASSCLVVADRDQILLDMYCTEANRDVFESRGVAPGSNWDERIAGTNGVSISSFCGGPVTVRGGEHFYQSLRPFACTAVPVRDERNDVIAYINLTTLDRGNTADFAFARHVLGSAADHLQAWLFLRRFRNHVTLRVSGGAAARPERSNALVALDENGRIVALTDAAREVLPCRDDAASLQGKVFEECAGTSLDHIVGLVPERMLSLTPPGAVRVSTARPPEKGKTSARPQPAKSSALSPEFIALTQCGMVAPSRLDQAYRLVQGGSPMLICGPTGSGKSHFALTLLAEAAPENPPQIFDIESEGEAELASHIRSWSKGETPAPASLLIENIDALSARQQKALLSWLERPAMQRAPRIRLIATSANSSGVMARLVPGLAHYIGGFVLDLAPVRDLESRERLARHLLRQLQPEGAPVLCADTMAAIAAYDWPGNIRELRSALDIARASCNGAVIAPQDLPAHVASKVGRPAEPGEGRDIADALRLSDWNVSRAAKVLGLSRATINRRIRELGLQRPGK